MTDLSAVIIGCASSSIAPIAMSNYPPALFALQADGDFPGFRKSRQRLLDKAPQSGFMLLFHFSADWLRSICNTRSGLCKKLADE